jgi:uracil-DNA glycosylase family 4
MRTSRIPFDAHCTLCPRLARELGKVRAEHPDYHARPVPPFGAADPGVLIVGLAPGLNGANRTGRPFTGDYAGILLYQTLHKHGLSNRPDATHLRDGLKLRGCRITNAVKCWPPANKPLPAEINTCNRYLAVELASLGTGSVVLALGRIAHDAVLKALGLKRSGFVFGHNALHVLPDGRRLLDSYHCSRYNTQTGRLTPAMFETVVKRAKRLGGG